MDGLTALVAAAQGGDQGAFGELVARFQDKAYAIAYGRLGDEGLAEEAAQDAFMEAFVSLSTLHEPAAFLAWFRTIVLHCCNRLARGKQLQAVPLEEADEALMDTPDPAEEHEMQDVVRNAVEELPEHERMVISLFHIAGYSQVEIAAFLEVPVTTVKKRLHDARKRLKERMMGMVEEYLQGQRPSKDDRFARRVQQSIILFSADSRFYAMHPDSSDIRPLTGPGTYTDIQWFPDGKKLLYGEGRVVDGLVVARHYTMNPDGSGKKAFGPDYVAGCSRVSPDGSRIAFVSHKDHPDLFPEFNRAEVYVMDADGSNVTRLTNNEVEDNAPAWTPDGRILFSRDVSGKSQKCQLFLINADGTGETGFPPGGPETFGKWPVFSSDGKRIAFVRWNNMRSELWVICADGANQSQLASVSRIHAPPSWSPDSRRIVFVADHQLYIVNADGSSGLKPEPVATGLKGVNAPVWGRGGSISGRPGVE